MENKRIWNLTWNCNVYAGDNDRTCVHPFTASYLFTDFETAKNETLRVIDKYVHSANGLFDGEGGIPEFEKAAERLMADRSDEDIERDKEELDERFKEVFGFDYEDDVFDERHSHELNHDLTRKFIKSLRESIAGGFKVKPVEIYGDLSFFIRIDSSTEEVFIHGVDDGPPCHLRINMFDMSDPEKDYYFEANDDFDMDRWEGETRRFSLYLFSMIPDEEIDLDIFE